MLHKNLIEILGKQGAVRDGDAWVVPQGVQTTVYLSLDEESLIIDKVSRLEIYNEFALILTQRKERYAVEVGEIRAVRSTPESNGPGYR
jgi:hypothetical protein